MVVARRVEAANVSDISQRILIKIAADHEVQAADPLLSPSPPCSLGVLVFPIHSLVAQRGLVQAIINVIT
jgi:hypothetical protein